MVHTGLKRLIKPMRQTNQPQGFLGGRVVSDIHAEMRVWRRHLAKCRESEETIPIPTEDN